jgi:RimJ/RimL family protein N-acetyltransferase
VEIGWRLSAEYWDRDYATEGARAALRFGFDALQLREIVALTVPGNVRSRRVMEKIGMVHNPADDFDHPLVPDGHPLRRHMLYRVSHPELPKKRLQPSAA